MKVEEYEEVLSQINQFRNYLITDIYQSIGVFLNEGSSYYLIAQKQLFRVDEDLKVLTLFINEAMRNDENT